MPFTPYHFGPGMMLKALLRRAFSFWIFVFAQVLTDCETLYFLVKGERPVHRLLHTYLGANITVVLAVLLGLPLYNGTVWILERFRRDGAVVARLGWGTAFVSAVIGAYSHVFLDSIMHSDARPFKPFSMENPLLWIMPLPTLLAFCVISGIVGLAVWAAVSIKKRSPLL